MTSSLRRDPSSALLRGTRMLLRLMFPLVVTSVGVAWIAWHLRVWRIASDTAAGDRERRFERQRVRRRLQTSALLSFTGLLMAVGVTIDRLSLPQAFIACWVGVLFLLGWICWLALRDLAASQQLLAELKGEQIARRALLEAEVARLKRAGAEPEGEE